MKKVLKYIFFLAVVFTGTTVSLTYFYKDKIIQHFIAQMNSRLNTPITVEKIDISVLDQLPYISVVLHDVKVQESYASSKKTLLETDRIACALNPFDMLTGDYSIQAVLLQNASFQLKVDEYNTPNFLIFNKQENTSNSTVLDLKKVTLINSKVSYQNDYGNKQVEFQTEKMKSSLQVHGEVYHIKSNGDIRIGELLVNDQSYLTGTEMNISSDLLYDQHQRTLAINPSIARYQGSSFDLSGAYGFAQNQLSLSLSSQSTNLRTIQELIPNRYLTRANRLDYTGDASFELTMNGVLQKSKLPPFQLTFNLNNTSVRDTIVPIQIENLRLIGYYQNTPKDSMVLQQVSGELNQKTFESDVSITNFQDPLLDLSFDGAISGATLQSLVDLPQVDSIQGEIVLDFTLTGKVSDLKNRKTIPKVRTTGDVTISDLNIVLVERSYDLQQLQGNFIFNNNDLAISGFSGMIGDSDFELTGLIKNFLVFSMLDNQPLGIEADFSSDHLNLDQLLTAHGFSNNDDQSYHFSISPQLYLKLKCDIGDLQFRRFTGQSIRGNLDVKHQIVSSKEIRLKTMGGDILLSGDINAKSDSIYVTSRTEFSQIHIDSLFYIFENFNQSFLVDNHLKGVVDANIESQMTFDHSLDVNPASIIADINTTIIGGQLNNFEPMQKLSRYLDGDKLDHMTFAELANDIHVENQTLYLPQMQVNSNVSDITIGGTHTFDQRIDYSVSAPFNNRNKVDKDAAFGSIEASTTGRSRVFLKITGTTSDYDVSYDKSAVKKEVISDLKREVHQLKEAFRKKGKKKKKEIELEEEDYFDWDQ
jgi:hypothetical protein